jgi:GntR family transcriptional regulator
MTGNSTSVKGLTTVIAMTYGNAGTPPAGRQGPRYQAVADDLLERMHQGEFPPGARLPTEAQVMDQYEISITTARTAIRKLANMGVVETRHGLGTYVVERKLLRIYATHTEDLDRREGITAQDSWSTDVLEQGRTPSQRFECLNVPASADLAELLGVETESTLVMRRCWRSVDGIPASIESSVFPAWLVAEVPLLSSPHDIAQGTTSYLAESGRPMHWHEDRISSRQPTREEGSFFEAPSGVSALVRLRISFDEPDHGRVLRVMETAYRSDMHEIVYDVPGRGNRVALKPETTKTKKASTAA